LATFAALALVSCRSQAPEQRSTGVAYAGPVTLNLRTDLASKSAPVGTASHGERLELLETRRRFVKVRTAQGVVGWTDSNLLLTQQQMDDLSTLAGKAAKLPSQGVATVDDVVNMHTDPNRQSPSFFQIPEAAKVEVIGHRVAPRVQPVPSKPVVRRTSSNAAKKAKAKDSKKASGPVPPAPQAPVAPRNWQELSRPRAPELPGYAPPQSPPVPLDDWSLVRTHDGKSGWVLARMLTMAIPDEVAQYAEGHRITAYLPLGDVKDGNSIKHNWLWTTVSGGSHPYEFDSFRVFVWSAKRHHYETAYVERNITGYYPVETQALPGQDEKAFSLVLEDKDGKLYKRTYGFSGYHVRVISKIAYQPVAVPDTHAPLNLDPVPAQAAAESGGWKERLRNWRKRWF
jgi:uncharacterized protein YgiM (DUF1202 family)